MLNANLTRRTCLNPRPGFQSFFSVFTHISPLVAMFGWKIFVKKNPANQMKGKESTDFQLKASFDKGRTLEISEDNYLLGEIEGNRETIIASS